MILGSKRESRTGEQDDFAARGKNERPAHNTVRRKGGKHEGHRIFAKPNGLHFQGEYAERNVTPM